MSVSRECRVLSGRGLCDGPITRPEESYRLWCVTVCDLETSRIRTPWPALGCWDRKKKDRRRLNWVSIPGQDKLVSLVPHPHRFWDTPRRLSSGYG